jgi:hypothetical protein
MNPCLMIVGPDPYQSKKKILNKSPEWYAFKSYHIMSKPITLSKMLTF